jgi:hypothetical protein
MGPVLGRPVPRRRETAFPPPKWESLSRLLLSIVEKGCKSLPVGQTLILGWPLPTYSIAELRLIPVIFGYAVFPGRNIETGTRTLSRRT